MEKIKKYIFILFGCMIAAFGFNAFLIPNSIAAGGFSGLAILINSITGVGVGAIVVMMNIPLFVLAFLKLGKKFVIISGIATLIFSAMIDYFTFIPFLTDDLVLCAIYGGLSVGLGFGIILKYGATTGGTDMLAKLIGLKHKEFPIGQMMFIMDLIVIGASILIIGFEQGLYAVISVFISAKVIDMVIEGTNNSKAFIIVTSKADEISAKIMDELERGVTAWKGKGLYTNHEKTILLCAVNNRTEIAQMKDIIKEIDRRAFVLVASTTEILGEGFYDFN